MLDKFDSIICLVLSYEDENIIFFCKKLQKNNLCIESMAIILLQNLLLQYLIYNSIIYHRIELVISFLNRVNISASIHMYLITE